MFFVLSKFGGFFVQPSNVLIASAVVGLLLTRTRFAQLGQRMMTLAVVLLGVFAILPMGNWILLPLEERFPPWNESHGGPDGIIVLGGVFNPETSAARPYPGINDAVERISATSRLAKRYPQARIVYAGGTEAETAARVLEDFGIPRARVELENRSRNTIENAIFTKKVVNPKLRERWLLVTSAFHMPRAIGVFRRNDFPVEAYPVDWRVSGPQDLLSFSPSFSDGLVRVDLGLHEWAGLIAYWVSGKTSALFPAPDKRRDE
jgi:uncharacterized SAM-binding protein YcdF (DUF218 family)